MKLEDFRDIEPGTRLEFFEPETCRAIRKETGWQFPKEPYRPVNEHFFERVANATIRYEYVVDNEVKVQIDGDFRIGTSVTRRIRPEYIRGVL